jgi:hypothetical protein
MHGKLASCLCLSQRAKLMWLIGSGTGTLLFCDPHHDFAAVANVLRPETQNRIIKNEANIFTSSIFYRILICHE